MGKLRTIILITGILIAGLAFNASAQKRPHNTSSAKATYSYKSNKPRYKIKKNNKQKHALRKQAKKTRAFLGEARLKEFI